MFLFTLNIHVHQCSMYGYPVLLRRYMTCVDVICMCRVECSDSVCTYIIHLPVLVDIYK